MKGKGEKWEANPKKPMRETYVANPKKAKGETYVANPKAKPNASSSLAKVKVLNKNPLNDGKTGGKSGKGGPMAMKDKMDKGPKRNPYK